MHMLEAGVPIMSIKNFLGHDYVMTTERYAELSQSTVDKQIKAWNQRWFQDTASTAEPMERKCNISNFLKRHFTFLQYLIRVTPVFLTVLLMSCGV